jgi:hypothetical protein
LAFKTNGHLFTENISDWNDKGVAMNKIATNKINEIITWTTFIVLGPDLFELVGDGGVVSPLPGLEAAVPGGGRHQPQVSRGRRRRALVAAVLRLAARRRWKGTQPSCSV